ncbi:MAG: hypothetical protein IAF38_14795 [Bacteroidia bacterium]|nr:hypothetical protein [Bacteroidia bacterium]
MSLFILLSFSTLSVLFLSCGSEKTELAEENKIPPVKIPPAAYLLDVEISRFIGNDAVPDFKFNADFVKQQKLKKIICFEHDVVFARPKDTLTYKPRYIWVLSPEGVTKELHFFGANREKLHSEYYLYENEIQSLAARNIDLELSAVTIFKYKDSLSQGQGNLIRETRTEPETADTTSYYYTKGFADSLKISSFSGTGFYIKFFRYDNGVVKQRIVKEISKKEIVKEWTYNYDADGNLTTIEESNADGGIYSFLWDTKGRISFIEYRQQNKLLFSKTMTYDNAGFLKTIVLEDEGGRRIFEFIYE